MPGDRLGLTFAVWLVAAVVHYSYASAQFTISQSLVPSRSRAYATGLQRSMTVTTLVFVPTALCYWLSSRWLQQDRLAALSKD